MAQTLNRIYPLYLAIDCSGSMKEPLNPFDSTRRIDLAKNFPLGIFQLYEESQDLVAHLRVSVFTFNRLATQVLPISQVTEIRNMDFEWKPEKKTFFANLFRALESQIQTDKSLFERDYDLHNPAVVIVTDGVPSDDLDAQENEQSRKAAWHSLVGTPGFNQNVQVVMYGIGMARQDFLSSFATHPGLAIRANSELPIAQQMETLVVKLKRTLRRSLLDGANLSDSSTNSQPWVTPDDPTQDEDELW